MALVKQNMFFKYVRRKYKIDDTLMIMKVIKTSSKKRYHFADFTDFYFIQQDYLVLKTYMLFSPVDHLRSVNTKRKTNKNAYV